MEALNRVMNLAVPVAAPENFIKRNVYPRVLVVGMIPLEICGVIRESFKFPVQTVGVALKFTPWLATYFIESHALQKYEKKFSGPLDLWKTVKKIIYCVIGLMSTLFIGAVSPGLNYRVHLALDLVEDTRPDSPKNMAKREEQELVRRQKRELIVQVEEILRDKGSLGVAA